MACYEHLPIYKAALDMTLNWITLISARGHCYRACKLALAQLASKRFPLEKVITHHFGLKDADLAIHLVGYAGMPAVIHALLMPGTNFQIG